MQIPVWLCGVSLAAASASFSAVLILKPVRFEFGGLGFGSSEIGISSGAVVAFDRSDLDEERCPSGWSPFLESRGRVLVGADKTSRAPGGMRFDRPGMELRERGFRSWGGEAAVVLTEAQMPRHEHSQYGGAARHYGGNMETPADGNNLFIEALGARGLKQSIGTSGTGRPITICLLT